MFHNFSAVTRLVRFAFTPESPKASPMYCSSSTTGRVKHPRPYVFTVVGTSNAVRQYLVIVMNSSLDGATIVFRSFGEI